MNQLNQKIHATIELSFRNIQLKMNDIFQIKENWEIIYGYGHSVYKQVSTLIFLKQLD